PALAFDAAEVEPHRRPRQVCGVGYEAVAVEIFGEDLLADGARFGLVHAIEAEGAPRFFRTFDDEGRAVGREAVGVRPDPAMLGLLEGEGEGVEHFRRAEPDETVVADVDVDPERVRLCIAEARVDAVAGDDQIVVAPLGVGGIAFSVELQGDAELTRAVLENLEQALAADADESVAARGDGLPPEMD